MRDFWYAFEYPTLYDKSVLEIGCGRGRRLLQAVNAGARRVVGIDPDVQALDVARTAVGERAQLFAGVIEEFPLEQFDIIISESTLEHIVNVPQLLEECKSRLTANGRLYFVFGPLYHAPDGDHGWLRATLPGYPYIPWYWGHLLFAPIAERRLRKSHGPQWPYLHLNKHTVQEFTAMFQASGLHIISYKTNIMHHSYRGRLLARLARIPLLTKYCTLNISVVAQTEGGR